MELVVRGLAIYVVLFILMRASGNRQFSDMTAFDAVLVILIAEVTGQALVGEDYSLTAAVVVLTVIVAVDIAVSLAKHRWKGLRDLVDGTSVLLIDNGKVRQRVFDKERVELKDVLDAARINHGIERLDQVKHAVLEPNGQISIIPK
jgi:uncharacterized membrane protein YcaP (DUF421 family)